MLQARAIDESCFNLQYYTNILHSFFLHNEPSRIFWITELFQHNLLKNNQMPIDLLKYQWTNTCLNLNLLRLLQINYILCIDFHMGAFGL